MKEKGAFGAHSGFARASLGLVCSLFVLALIAAASSRIQLRPQFRPGDRLYYQIETHAVSTGTTTTPILNPEGGTKFSENADLLVRLDVLPAALDSAAEKSQQGREAGTVRMRVTYERAHADSQADAPEFDTPSASQEYDRLAGHSFEFTVDPSGAVTNLQDADNLLGSFGDAATALSWTKTLASSTGFPARGVSIGGKWTSDKPLTGAPLAGLIWHTQSTYLRNEPCRVAAAGDGAKQNNGIAGQRCAVILTQFRILQRRSSHADQTPPDYMRHGLRTSGTLTGSGESLDSFSLPSGFLVSSTQSSMQRSDFDIVNAANGEKIHRAGQVQMQMVITRVAKPLDTKPSPPGP